MISHIAQSDSQLEQTFFSLKTNTNSNQVQDMVHVYHDSVIILDIFRTGNVPIFYDFWNKWSKIYQILYPLEKNKNSFSQCFVHSRQTGNFCLDLQRETLLMMSSVPACTSNVRSRAGRRCIPGPPPPHYMHRLCSANCDKKYTGVWSIVQWIFAVNLEKIH